MKIFKVTTLCAMLLTGCGQDGIDVAQPREPDQHSVGFFCRMAIKEHTGPKGQILPKGWADPLWFSSVRDALSYAETEVVSEKEMAGFWVNDMGQGTWAKPLPSAWVEARAAWFVIGSRMDASMGGVEAVPFKERSKAEAYAVTNGGRVVGYDEAKRSVTSADTLDQGGPS